MNIKGTVLVTDSLFIDPSNIEQLLQAGFAVERLNIPNATPSQLINALQNKVGYILGGVEKVTEEVIRNSPSLKAITFTGADWKAYIPGHPLATERGIKISNCPGANAASVAELTLLGILSMLRNFFDLGPTGSQPFLTSKSLRDTKIGIVGMGKIAEELAHMLSSLGTKELCYTNRTRYPLLENKFQMSFTSLDQLLSSCDVVCLLASSDRGEQYIGAKQLQLLKDGSLLVNTSFIEAVDREALYQELTSGRLKAFVDNDYNDPRFQKLAYHQFFFTRHTAYNTKHACERTSAMATQSMINMLISGEDQFVQNKKSIELTDKNTFRPL